MSNEEYMSIVEWVRKRFLSELGVVGSPIVKEPKTEEEKKPVPDLSCRYCKGTGIIMLFSSNVVCDCMLKRGENR